MGVFSGFRQQILPLKKISLGVCLLPQAETSLSPDRVTQEEEALRGCSWS